MPIVVPTVKTGHVVTPQFVPPDSIGVKVDADAYRFDTPEDFFAPDIAAHLGTNVFSGTRRLDPKFSGMHYHAEVPTVRHAIARNVDVPGCLWSDIEASGQGRYEWSALDRFVAGAASAGRDVVYCLLSTPGWASARPGEAGHYAQGGDAEPANPQHAGEFVAAVCARYKALGTPIKAFEIWNEPKYHDGGGVALGNYFTGTPEALAQMARAVWQQVKAVDNQALVLSPSPTGLESPWLPGDGSGTDKLDRFLGAADGAGGTGRDWVDAIAFHAYSHNGRNDVYAIPQMFANVRSCMAAHNLDGRDIWVTETSAITPPLASHVAQHQCEFIARTLLLAAGAGAARVIWYAWDDSLGFHRQPSVESYWDELTGALAGATVTLVNSLRNFRVAAIVDGKRYLV
jgi:hypothetical protein